ncbi:unnamed protein product [Calypogeia fissa]
MTQACIKRGNGVMGIRREEHSKWERRAPLTPAHCARLLNFGRYGNGEGVDRILVQPCTKRIHSDMQYEEVGCEISEDLSACGFIAGVKRPEPGTLLPDRAYSFFSHTHKAQPENMPLLDEILQKRISLYDFELITGDKNERLVAFGEYAGRAGMLDFFRGLGERFLSLGFSTPFLSLGSSYMYSSLTAAKAAVVAVGDEIASAGLPLGICPLVFVFTGSGNVSRGAQEIFQLLPHSFVKPSDLPQLYETQTKPAMNGNFSRKQKANFKIYGCVVESLDMVAPNDYEKSFDKADYYAHPEDYHSIFHEKIAPYTSVIVNCMYWERRFPRLLTNEQLRQLTRTYSRTEAQRTWSRLLGVADITCDVEGSIECLHQTTPIEQPFFRYNPSSGSYHNDMDGDGIIFLAVDCLPTELPKEATKHFGDVLFPFISNMARGQSPDEMVPPIKRACIAHNGKLTHLYDYIERMRQGDIKVVESPASLDSKKNGSFTRVVSLNGHLFDQFLINEALDVISAAGGRFRLATCKLGQSDEEISHADLEVEAESEEQLVKIVDALAAVAAHSETHIVDAILGGDERRTSYQQSRLRRASNSPVLTEAMDEDQVLTVLILGAGRMSEPAVTYLAFHGNNLPSAGGKSSKRKLQVVVASLYLQDAQMVTHGIENASAMELDISNKDQLRDCVSKASVVISLLPAACHVPIAEACIEFKKHLVTASYVSPEMASLHERAKDSGVAILCEMGLDPGIDHMMAMQMIDGAHSRGGHIQSFVSYCGGLPSPMAANNPLGYKFSWNPAGAIKAGRNPAIYKEGGKVIEVAGENLLSSAVRLRLPNLPAFALERLPNRDSLQYGELYGIAQEASTVFRATLRYEGFSELMDGIGKLGFFNFDSHPLLEPKKADSPAYQRATFELFLEHTFKQLSQALEPNSKETAIGKLVTLGCCADMAAAKRLWHCLRWLGLDSKEEVPESCKSAFDVLCHCMESRLIFAPNEQDLVLLHHELEVAFDGGPTERHTATLLTLGETANSCGNSPGGPQSAMARTVGLTVAIGAQLLLFDEVKSRGVLRPMQAEVYDPTLRILAAHGLQLEENWELL